MGTGRALRCGAQRRQSQQAATQAHEDGRTHTVTERRGLGGTDACQTNSLFPPLSLVPSTSVLRECRAPTGATTAAATHSTTKTQAKAVQGDRGGRGNMKYSEDGWQGGKQGRLDLVTHT